MPRNFIVEISEDNKTFIKVFEANDFLLVEDVEPKTKNISATFSSIRARYVRIKAKQFCKFPAWHEGAGGATHIFVDEILIK